MTDTPQRIEYPAELESVEVHPDYPAVLRVRTSDGAWWHYLADSSGRLELGQPYLVWADGYRVHLFVPLAPGAMPRVMRVQH